MSHRRRTLLVLLGTLGSQPRDSWALLSIEERLPLIQRRARLLRQALLQHPHGTQHIERTYNTIMELAEAHWDANRPEDALAELSALQTYAPLAELPFVKAQLLMAAISAEQQRAEDKMHHRAFAMALIQDIQRDADGTGPDKAYKLVLPSEATAWLISKGEGHQLMAKEALRASPQHLHLWRVRSPSGAVMPVYFQWKDVPAKQRK
jgi:hypothetical protein